MANFFRINLESKKWLVASSLILTWTSPFTGVNAALLSVDSPEVISRNVEIDSLNLVRTKYDHEGDYLYVFKESRRIWKSQKIIGSFDYTLYQKLIDLDENGIKDVLWITASDRKECNALDIFTSFNHGQLNYYMTYGQGSQEDESQPGGHKSFLEVSSPAPSKELLLQVGTKLRKILGDNCKGKVIERMIVNGDYQVNDPPASITNIEEAHAKSIELYKTYKVTPKDIAKVKVYNPSPDIRMIRAMKVLEPLQSVLYNLDFREVDPKNINPHYTQILNDYGFLLQESGFVDKSVATILQYISSRDPTWTSIKPVEKQLERIELPAYAKNPKYWVGKYFLEGERETGSTLILNDTGRFQYSFAYGAYSRYAKGTWVLNEDGYIVLNSDGKVKKPRFVLKSSEKRLDDKLSVLVNLENGNGQHGVDVIVRCENQPEITGYTQSDGLLIPLPHAPQSIGLGIDIYNIEPQWFKLDSNSHNYFVFEFQPGNLGEERLSNVPLRPENNTLIFESRDQQLRYVKR